MPQSSAKTRMVAPSSTACKSRVEAVIAVDGSVNGVAVLVQSGARAFRLLQTGLVQNYLLVMALGVFVFATLYLIFT